MFGKKAETEVVEEVEHELRFKEWFNLKFKSWLHIDYLLHPPREVNGIQVTVLAIVDSYFMVPIASHPKDEPPIQGVSSGALCADKCAVNEYLISAHLLRYYRHLYVGWRWLQLWRLNLTSGIGG